MIGSQPILPQNKINGMSIAWARAKWAELEDGDEGFSIQDEDAFSFRVSPQWLQSNKVDEDDLFDCIDQIEEKLGSPREHRVSLGLFPNSGYSNVGITVVSRSNPAVNCVYTPTSMEGGDYDGYFEWYYHAEKVGMNNIDQFLAHFDMAAGVETTKMLSSPVVMPSYDEAWEKTANLMEGAKRENFLRDVWNYHRTTSRGFKIRLEQELLPVWKGILEAKV